MMEVLMQILMGKEVCEMVIMQKAGKFYLSLLALVCFYCMGSYAVVGYDMITKDKYIIDGETLVSSNGIFELGFFSPHNSTNRYVGIWYKKIQQTVVWVANREKSLVDYTGTLMINKEGYLSVVDSRGMTYLSAYGTGNTSAKLLDVGNLVLRDEDGNILWQSFDYPTDTLLPGMKLGLNLKTKQNRLFVAWRSEEDVSAGVYSYAADPNGTAQFFIWQEKVVYWTSGLWNGEMFSLVPKMRHNYIYNFSLVANENEQYFTYHLYNCSSISRITIDKSGQIQALVWSDSSQQWLLSWAAPRDTCDVYALCGSYASCNLKDVTPCKCLQGFVPVSSKDWESNNWSEGCKRESQLKCEDGDGDGDKFRQLRNANFPHQEQYVNVKGQDPKECEAFCVKNCSCSAYASANRTNCMFWSGDLMGLREDYNRTAGPNLFIRVAASRFSDGHKRKISVIIAGIIASLFFFMLSGFLCYWRETHKRKGIAKIKKELLDLGLDPNIAATTKFNIRYKFGTDEKGSEFRLFNFATIEAATTNFSTASKLGEGGFGPVYKGILPDGQEIAIKRLSPSSGQGLEEFKNEIRLISKLQHTNLVRLLGCCIQEGEKLLVYEYMPNKSLDVFLFDPTKRRALDCEKRVRIIEGIAQGLLYLHNYSRLRVIHRDLKASNVLLDGDMNPRISDFGMARIFRHDESETNTHRIVGTYGYMSPEYAMRGIFSVKSDVFSFGVLLLEIITGKKITTIHHSECSLNFLGHAWELWEEGRGVELMDPMFHDSSRAYEHMRYINVALLCVQENAMDRPFMLDVVSMLGNETAALRIPKKPAFSFAPKEISANSPSNNTWSDNGLTVSLVEAR
ncbi:hypothetical protein GIB67_032555 [Kingdonia uniflora]|uniref:Receptor-like serine/threonine-protein kinase n=1 Tax=Kingdonia uniflora TaxID=39325 RepID=A0A7J7LSB2_9MAGN|nr:hypothetical protein GIB67_032555 [Kingdonia uniflora]